MRNMRKKNVSDYNQVVLVCLFITCVALVIAIFFASRHIETMGEAVEQGATKQDVANAFAVLHQNEAVRQILETQSEPYTYQNYRELLEALHLWDAVNMEELCDWESCSKTQLSKSHLQESVGRIEELFVTSAQVELPIQEELPVVAPVPAVDENTQVRVLLLQDGAHTASDISFSANASYTIEIGETIKTKKKKKVLQASQLKLDVGQTAKVCTEQGELYLTDENGERKTLGYKGYFEITRYEDGYAVVNVVPIEHYLYGVVQSEMPAYFELEALRAQAICARTYIVSELSQDHYPEYQADVDDSVRFQVYNQAAPDEHVIEAVDSTRGQILKSGEESIYAYFFSTSHGMTSNREIWEMSGLDYLHCVRENAQTQIVDLSQEEVFRAYIREQNEADYDYESGYYRWKALLDIETRTEATYEILEQIALSHPEAVVVKTTDGEEVQIQTLREWGDIRQLKVTGRSTSGAVLGVQIIFEEGIVELVNESYIRQLFGAWIQTLQDKDGEMLETGNYLPSVYFYIQPIKDGIVLFGGGLGHGIGMSQYGANGMAKNGASAEEILMYYYTNVTIHQLYGEK
ncbi:MAG: SpoIID/LytB domain-containing protein [Eubacterium sp.]|nr:SpoIID/LytB domain-containing protein [Eubacterium sp.]